MIRAKISIIDDFGREVEVTATADTILGIPWLAMTDSVEDVYSDRLLTEDFLAGKCGCGGECGCEIFPDRETTIDT